MVTKQVTGIVVDKSIEDIDSIINKRTEKIKTNQKYKKTKNKYSLLNFVQNGKIKKKT